MESPRFYKRNLPHWQPEGVTFAVQFCLTGCLPRHVVLALQADRDRKLSEVNSTRIKYAEQYPNGIPDELEEQLNSDYRAAKNQYNGKFDEILDGESYGPNWLIDPKVAKIVADALHYAEDELKSCHIWAYCIMPNHVHLILSNVNPVLHKVLASVKIYSARIANQYLNRTGNQFWHRESYDRIIRNKKEFDNQITYVVNNPVKAGLVSDWQEWRFTYLNDQYSI
ncbi:MAG: transposase [Bacteroidota bacterium]